MSGLTTGRSVFSVALAFACQLTSSCASPEIKAARRATTPAWECYTTRTAGVTSLSASRTLNAAGQEMTLSVSWSTDVGSAFDPRIYAFWTAIRRSALNAENGSVNISWHLVNLRKNRPAQQRLRLELQGKDARTGALGQPVTAKHQSSFGLFSLAIRWGDLIAMEDHASELVLIVRDQNGAVVKQTALRPSLFSDALPQVTDMVDKARRIPADDPKSCSRVGTDDIIVT